MGYTPSADGLHLLWLIGNTPFTTKQLRVQGIFGASSAAWRWAVELFASGRLPLADLISHRFSLERFEAAFATLDDEIPEIVQVASPVYLKFGLRNAPDIYPSGGHLVSTAVALCRERVRRARLGLDLLMRSGEAARTSELGAAGLAVPVPGSGVRPANIE